MQASAKKRGLLIPKVFDLLVQGPCTLDRSLGGLGLGLPIAQRMAEMHGGHISATSEGLNKGSTFVITVPLVAPAKRSVSARTGVNMPNPLENTPDVIRRVLVVDDNRDAAEMLCEALQMRGHTLDMAFDGAQVAEHVRAFNPDVVLMDIGLPTMDGYAVARQLRADPEVSSTLKLVAVTGYGHEEDRKLALDAGFNHHLVKPVDLDRIYQLLQSL